MSAQSVEELIFLNLTAPALIARQFLRSARPQSTLVNVTSITGIVPMPGNTLYCAAKAGLTVLSECLWFEARPSGIRVMHFCPVSLKTKFHGRAGRASLTGEGMAVDPKRAASDLVRAIERGREFAFPYGKLAKILGLANRLLPRKFIVSAMGKRSLRAGYLAQARR